MNATAFPELQLADFASTYRESWPQLANLCRNVLACHDALRERCLLAELERDQCEHVVRLYLDPDLWPAVLGEQTAD